MPFQENDEISEHMETVEQVYKGITPYQNNHREDSKSASHGSKRKGVGAAALYNPKKGRADKRKMCQLEIKSAHCMIPDTL